MPIGDITGDDPSIGQDEGSPSPGGPPGGGGPPSGPPQAGGFLASLARSQQGPQVSAPGPGDTAAAMNAISQAIDLLQTAVQGLPKGERLHTDVLRAAQTLSRHLGQGGMGMGPGAGMQKTSLMDQLRGTVRNMMLQRVQSMQNQQPGQGGGGAPAPPGMPSTPLPGA